MYSAQEHDPIIDYITAAIKNDDTTAQVKDDYSGYNDIFDSLYQTYGRKVEIEFLHGIRAAPSTRWRRAPTR